MATMRGLVSEMYAETLLAAAASRASVEAEERTGWA